MPKESAASKLAKLNAKNQSLSEVLVEEDDVSVVQDYRCRMSVVGGDGTVVDEGGAGSGRVFVLVSGFVFVRTGLLGDVGAVREEDVRIRRRWQVMRGASLAGKDGKHTVSLGAADGTTIVFSRFWSKGAARELFELCDHLVRHVPAEVSTAFQARLVAEATARLPPLPTAKTPAASTTSPALSSSPSSDGRRSFAVDNDSATRALQTVDRLREMSKGIQEEVSAQGNTIRAVDQGLGEVAGAVDEAEVDVASYRGKKKSTGTGRRGSRGGLGASRMLTPGASTVDFPVLLKRPADDALLPARFRFASDVFTILQPDVDEVIPEAGSERLYREVGCIVVRVRPLHVDLRFGVRSDYLDMTRKPPSRTKRLRLVTAHLQEVIHTLVMRAHLPPECVHFESPRTSVKVGPALLSEASVLAAFHRRAPAADAATSSLSFRRSVRQPPTSASTLTATADDETVAALRKQEETVRVVQAGVADLRLAADALGNNLTQQTTAVRRLGEGAGGVGDRYSVVVDQLK